MLISEIQKKVINEKSAVLIRPRNHVRGQPKQYDVKQLFTGNKHGWTLLDVTTVNALNTCYNGLSGINKAKWDNVPVMRLIDFAWRHVR